MNEATALFALFIMIMMMIIIIVIFFPVKPLSNPSLCLILVKLAK